MKKILSLLLATVMLSGCTVTASAAEEMPLELVYSTMRESQNPVKAPEIIIPSGVTPATVSDMQLGDDITIACDSTAAYGGASPYWEESETSKSLTNDLTFYINSNVEGEFELSARITDGWYKTMNIVINGATVFENCLATGIWQEGAFEFHDVSYGNIILKKGVNTITFVGVTNPNQIAIASINLLYASTASNQLTVSALIKNKTAADVTDAQIVAALYENDRLFDVSASKVTIEANSSIETAFSFLSQLGSDMYKEYDTKFFLWDGLESVKPLANSNESKYSTINYFTTSEIKPWLSTLHLTPDADAQLGDLGGEGGQQTYSIAVSPFDRNIALIGTDTVGVYKTTDGGRNWRSASSGLNYGRMNDLTYDTLNEGVVYAIEGGPSAGSTLTGVYKSTDNGNSWTLDLNVHYTLSQLGGADQLRWQTVNGTRYLYAATMGTGIWRKEGNADDSTWEQVYSGTEIFTDLYTDDTGLIVGVGYTTVTNDDGTTTNEYKLVKSTDNGTSFTTSAATANLISLEVSPKDSNLWVANDSKSIYKSTDAGTTWTRINQLYNDTQKSTLRAVRFTGYKASGALYPRLYISFNQVSCAWQYSDNLGGNVTRPRFYHSDGTAHAEQSFWAESFDIPGSDGAMYMMHDGFATSTDGGTTWTTVKAKGFSGTPMTDMEFDTDGSLLWMSSIDAGIWRAEDVDNNGKVTPTIKQHNFPRFDGEGGYANGSKSSGAVEVDPNDPNHLLGVTGNYGYGGSTAIIQSFDGGVRWDTIRDSEGNAISENLGIGGVRYSPVNDNLIFAGPLRSTDNGKTWEFISKVAYETTDSETGETVTAYKTISVADVSDSGKLVGYFKETADHNIYISEDNGTTWTAHNTGTWSISAIQFDIFDDNYVWLSKYTTLQKYNVTNDTATRVLDEVYSIRHFAQNPKDPNHMLITRHDYSSLVMRNNTVYETYDGGKTWHEIEGFNYMSNPGRIVFHPTEPYVYISTYLGTQVLDYNIHRAYIEAMAE